MRPPGGAALRPGHVREAYGVCSRDPPVGRGPRRGGGVRGRALCRGNSQSGQQHSTPSRGRRKCFGAGGLVFWAAKPTAQDEQSHTSARSPQLSYTRRQVCPVLTTQHFLTGHVSKVPREQLLGEYGPGTYRTASCCLPDHEAVYLLAFPNVILPQPLR